ncbi:TIGR03808 family TAT-translocated repetitive protein [Pleomorphomonas sp. JP5]|uniref:TIGR03808 family TAT-translocated repetitive protein n=1 Tax=Pleomorphomonas sp. JP5 TaxID=2942998 RepID=UPI0020434986|nr:TIGR03808 family TAT-translocated repetitive protein [Pleomorphomonas sp. JP5]MCM5556107.1 TIGR03808 family TAT-translocated repetitive protein [Pleomorphomonas sp. JP5]
MNRRTFLFGTIASLALPAVARSGTLGIDLPELRGSLSVPQARTVARRTGDRSVELQSAINRAAAAGRPLRIPSGRYEVSNIRLPDRARLVGVPGETHLVYSGGGRFLYSEDARSLSLEGLTLDGANRTLSDEDDGLLSLAFAEDVDLAHLTVQGSVGHGIALTRAGGSLRDCRISGANGAGIMSTEGKALEISGNAVSDCVGGGVHLRRWVVGDDGSTVRDNRIRGTGGAGIRLSSAGGVRISGNDLQATEGPAIVADAASAGTSVSNNTIDGAALGVALLGGRDDRLSLVSGNIVRNVTSASELVSAGRRRGGVGIHVETHGSVTGNVVEATPHLGLSLGWGATLGNVVASGNVVRRAGTGIGVSVLASESATIVAGNLLVDVPGGAVRGMRYAEYATDDLTRVGVAAWPGLTVGENRVA